MARGLTREKRPPCGPCLKGRVEAMKDVILELQDLTKEFPGVRALDRVNIQVKRGEIHALCGENGAGKSTLI